MELSTNDQCIRTAFRQVLEGLGTEEKKGRIVEEFGVGNGLARLDIAVLDKGIHGYEVKSDVDTLSRLPDQIRIYNEALESVTIIVGRKHLYQAINLIPDWWGIILAKKTTDPEEIVFTKIREAGINPQQNSQSLASLLWRSEALELLKELGEDEGFRTKNREMLYSRLARVVDSNLLKEKITQILCARFVERSEMLCMRDGG